MKITGVLTLAAAVLISAMNPTRANGADAVDGPSAQVKGQENRVALTRVGDTILIDVEQAGKAWGWTMKSVGEGEGRMLVACRETICLPIPLNSTHHRTIEDRLFVDAASLGRTMGFKVETKGDQVTLVPSQEVKAATQPVPAYHDDWGKDRGFRKGQTLPDIPLVDMNGNEVRFGQYLGKQYILYGWASW